MAYKNTSFQIKLPLLIGIAITIGILAGAAVFGRKGSQPSIATDYARLREVIKIINTEYVDSVDNRELINEAIQEMVSQLDPHTAFIPAKEVAFAQSQLESNFDGIGIEFYIMKDTLTVITALQGGPSQKAGLRSGDKILYAGDVPLSGPESSQDKVFKTLRGKRGTAVELTVMRYGDTFKTTVTRDKITSPSVTSGYLMDDKRTAYIKINRFAERTYKEFKASLEKLQDAGASRLMIDLRDNPGGYLTAAVKIADELIAGKDMIVYTKGRSNKGQDEHHAGHEGIFEQNPVVVLINGGSASASEILAGALQDNDRAIIVGRRSYGKGLVQYPYTLSDGSQLRLTVSRYYTPSGRSIQKPYEQGKGEEYGQELIDRYEHGEMFNADSIFFDEKQRYKTAAGRTVYGGGGIMPDYFVPLDSSSGTLMQTLFGQSAIRETAYYVANKEEKQFKENGSNWFIHEYRPSEQVMSRIFNTIPDSVQITRQDKTVSMNRIETLLKAHIARSIWDDAVFYRILNGSDPMVKQALDKFDEAAALQKR